MTALQFHPVADVFPMLPQAELETLAADIKANGLHHAITMFDGKVLDGRNRYVACELAGVDPRFEEYTGGDPVAFIVSENISRRHLDESQRAMCAARLANMRNGDFHGNQYTEVSANLQTPQISQSSSAEMLNVSPRSVASANTVIANGVPELVQAVDAELVAVSVAAKIAEMPEAKQNEIVKRIKAGSKPADAIREVKREEKRTRPMPTGKYRIIYADPPWKYGNNGLDDYGHAERHYPTMSIAELCALDVRTLAADDAVLFLWVTSPLLEECFAVIHAWGFEYKTSFVWDKVSHNFGYYNSVRHELLLVCTRGSCLPDEKTLFDSVQTIERTEHSVKPDEFRKIIETLYTWGSRVELFSRRDAPGWDTWGNEPDAN